MSASSFFKDAVSDGCCSVLSESSHCCLVIREDKYWNRKPENYTFVAAGKFSIMRPLTKAAYAKGKN